MRRAPARRPPAAAGEAGFTLVELLVAISISLLVLGGIILLLTSVLRSQPENADRAAQIQDARVVLERTVRELRQGRAVAGAAGTSTVLTVDAYTRSGCDGEPPTAEAVPCRVTYACIESGGSGSCTRRAGSGPATTVVSGLASPHVFSYGATTAPECNQTTIDTPTLVCLKLTYPDDDGEETITVEDSAYLRNPPL